ncbi:transcriptional regulator [Nocardia sp. NPDC005366]|uniref:MmyB family transcriptional regulator n=1 Tax=Nocardia sp. NPDC005366 TaxID=3156878 RepID=UPI0033AB6825
MTVHSWLVCDRGDSGSAEQARLAGLSVDYYIRLEQGRDRNPSREVLATLASALLLDREGSAHPEQLARLAGARMVLAAAPAGPAGAGMVSLLESVRPTPAFVLDQVSDLLAANPEGVRLLSGIADWEPVRRNLIRYVFTHPAARAVFEDWAGMARDCVAHLRVVQGAGTHATEMTALTSELCSASVDFEELWAHYDVRIKRGTRRIFRHPAVGRMELTSEILTAADGQRFVAFQAEPGSPDRDAVTLLGLVADDVPATRRRPAP